MIAPAAYQLRSPSMTSPDLGHIERISLLTKHIRRTEPSKRDQNGSAIEKSHTRLFLQPPDEASWALGMQLGTAFGSALVDIATLPLDAALSLSVRKMGSDVINLLSEVAPVRPSIASGFHHAVAEAMEAGLGSDVGKKALKLMTSWLPSWLVQSTKISQTEQNAMNFQIGVNSAMRSLIKASVRCTFLSSLSPGDTLGLNSVRSSLSNVAERHYLVRESVRVALSSVRDRKAKVSTATDFLSQLAVECALTPLSVDKGETILLWTSIIRECRFLALNDGVFILSWLAKVMSILLFRTQQGGSSSVEKNIDDAFLLLSHLCDFSCHLSAQISEESVPNAQIISEFNDFVNLALDKFLPCFLGMGYDISSFVVQLSNSLIQIFTTKYMPDKVSDVIIFRLSTIALTLQDESQILCILEVILNLVQSNCLYSSCGELVMVGTVRSLGFMFGASSICKEVATELKKLANSTEPLPQRNEKEAALDSYQHIIMLLGSTDFNQEDTDIVLKGFAPNSSNPLVSFSPTFEQSSALLLGSSILSISITKCHKVCRNKDPFEFLRAVLKCWPHLGVRTIPVVKNAIQSFISSSDSDRIMMSLEFLCFTATKDPICAQEVWFTLSGLVAKDAPSAVRLTCLRLYPSLCVSNRKLYGRVRDSLAKLVESSDAKIRISVMATLSELAKADNIRDVSDVIGWLQNGLSDEEPLVVYHVIMTLHHLVLEDELDFDTVMKVLCKKLVEIDNASDILLLPPVVIEALVQLFGDGAFVEADTYDDDEQEEAVSPQVTAAATCLVSIGLSLNSIQYESNESASRFSASELVRIQGLIFSALSNFSIASFGIESGDVREFVEKSGTYPNVPVTATVVRYLDLSRFSMDSLKHSSSVDILSFRYLAQLVTNILDFEEDMLGPSLWKRGVTIPSKISRKKVPNVSKPVSNVLPEASLVQSLYQNDPRTATAIAQMYSIDPGIEIVEILADLANDVRDDLNDPLFKALAISAWLEAMKGVWSSLVASDEVPKIHLIKAVIDQISEWSDFMDRHDSTYTAFAAFACALPDHYDGIDLNTALDDIQRLVVDSFDDRSHSNADERIVSLGLMGSRHARSLELDRVDHIINLLVRTLDTPSTECFSALYSLGMIAQTLFLVRSTSGREAAVSGNRIPSFITTIVSTMFSELHASLSKPSPRFLSLIACLKTGTPTPCLVSDLDSLCEDDIHVKQNMKLRTKGIFVALSLAIPALGLVNKAFLEGISVLMSKLPWGIGKGFIIPSMYHTISIPSPQDDIETALSRCVDALNDPDEGTCVDDAVFALVGLDKLILASDAEYENDRGDNPVLPLLCRILDVRQDDFDTEVKATAIFGACLYIGTAPSLGQDNISFSTSPYCHAHTDGASAKIVVELLKDMNKDAKRKCRDAAVIALGLLCRMKKVKDSNTFHRLRQSSQNKGRDTSKLAHRADLPIAQDNTLLRSILNELVPLLASSESRASLLVSSVVRLSLPIEFSSLARNTIEDINTESLTESFMDLLVSQVESQKHLAHRNEFLNQCTQIAKKPPADFWSLFKSQSVAPVRFMMSLSSLIPKLPSGVVADVIANLWGICCFEISDRGSTRSAKMFLSSLRKFHDDVVADKMNRTKKKTGRKGSLVSPAVITTIRHIVIGTIFRSLNKMLPGPGGIASYSEESIEDNLWLSFYYCLKQVPSSSLYETDFVILGKADEKFSTTISRLHCMAHLLKEREYFGTNTDVERLRAQLFISRQKYCDCNEEEIKSMRAAMILLAGPRLNACTNPHDSQKDLILQSLEYVLVNGLDSFALEQLAFQSAFWSAQNGTSVAATCYEYSSSQSGLLIKGTLELTFAGMSSIFLSQMFGLFLKDLPWKLASICQPLGISGLVANRCFRALDSAMAKEENGEIATVVPHADSYFTGRGIAALRGIAMCCSEPEANGAQFRQSTLSQLAHENIRL